MDKEIIILALCGACGAFVKDIFKDNYITLPCFKAGKFYLGCIGGIIIGAVAGLVADNNPLTAFLAGFAGYQLIEGLTNKKDTIIRSISETKTSEKETIIKEKDKEK